MVQEFSAFLEVQDEFDRLEQFYNGNLKQRNEFQHELEETAKSEKQSFGFFNPRSKEEVISGLISKISRIQDEINTEKKLLILASEVILNGEIPLIKDMKTERFETMLTEFVEERLRKIDVEMDLWRSVLPNNTDSNAGSRFTTLTR
jgi:hypothetical protein